MTRRRLKEIQKQIRCGVKSYKPTKAIREFVFERDNHTCQMCGKLATQVHHKTSWPEGKTILSNLISLCSKCHLGTAHYEDRLEVVRTRKERFDKALDYDQWIATIEKNLTLPEDQQVEIQTWPRRRCHRMEAVYARR